MCVCRRVHACSPSRLLITPLPLSVSLPPAPYVYVSLPLSSVISIWCILAAVVGSLFSMWAGLISVLWWQMQWLICFHGIMHLPKSLIYLDLCLPYTLSKWSNSILITQKDFLVVLFFYHTASHTNTHTVRTVLETRLRPASLPFRTLAWVQPTYELQFEWWWGHLMQVWVATCVGRLISQSLASGLLKGSGFGCLLHLSHIIPPICLLTWKGTGA